MRENLEKGCVDMYKEGSTQSEVARHIGEKTGLGLSQSKFWAKRIWSDNFDEEYVPANQRGYKVQDEKLKEAGSSKFTEDGDTATAESKDENVKTLDDLLRVCNVDLSVWNVDRHICNKWEVACKVDTKNGQEVQKTPLFQVKAFLSRKPEDKLKNVFEFIKQGVGQISPRPSTKDDRELKGKSIYEISIPDIHVAKLVWGKETGGDDYDIDIACATFRDAFYSLFYRVDISDIDEIIIPVGNDFFNTEGLTKATTKGTPQDEDGRWPKSFAAGCNLITGIVDDVSEEVNVRIVMVAGNHDLERNHYLGEYLKAWYRNSSSVTVDNSVTQRKYLKHGNTLLMWTHGSEEKHADLPLIMAREHEDFSKCKYFHAHLGHLHQDWLREYKGVKIRVLPSLVPADYWHSSKGYIGNMRSAVGFVYDSEMGEVANYYYNV